MAEETIPPVAPAPISTETIIEEVVTETEQPAPVPEVQVEDKSTTPAAELAAAEEAVLVEETKESDEADKTITQSVSFKEESNVVGELPDPQKKALEELKVLVQEALNKHELTAPPPPPPAKLEEKAVEEVVTTEEAKPEEPKTEEEKTEEPKTEEIAPKTEVPPVPAGEPVVVVEKVEAEVVDEDGAKTVEAIQETVVSLSTPVAEPETETLIGEAGQAAATPPEEVAVVAVIEEEVPLTPEEVSIWGIPLLADDRSDVILLKFLRARDFKPKEALTMIKNVVRWRKEFGIDTLLEEDLGNELAKVVYTHGFDKEGHPVCYNAFGEFMDKEFYQNTFGDEEKRTKFLKWRIQFLEKSIRKLDFSPTGVNTIVQVNDLNNFPGPGKRGLRQATNQALQLFQDNYPEFVAKQIFINVPWWYLAFNKMISPFLTLRTKSKFVFAGSAKSADTLFKYITPEQVPILYGGHSREGEQEFTTDESITEITIKPASKHIVEIPVSEASVLVWELRVVGWEVNYGAEFVPSAEGSYTVIVSKTRKVTVTDEAIIVDSFKIGEAGKVVLTIDNQGSKKKKLLYRSKTKPSPY
jgi:hypothetical protein